MLGAGHLCSLGRLTALSNATWAPLSGSNAESGRSPDIG
jgi:hypothetical protein